MLKAAEEGRVAKFAAKCSQLGEMPKLIKEIQEDAHFPETAKALLATSLPRLAAKWLNKSGLSAEYQDEVAVVTAILLIYQHDRKAMLKLDKIILELKAPREKKIEQPLFGAGAPVEVRGQPIPEARPAPKGAPPEVNVGQQQIIAKVNQ